MKQRNMYRRSFHVKATKSRKCGKRRYRSSIEAKIALADIHMKDSSTRSKQEMRAYYCRACNGWHLTSKPYRARPADDTGARVDTVNNAHTVRNAGTVNSVDGGVHADSAGSVRSADRGARGSAPLPSMLAGRMGHGLHVDPVDTGDEKVMVEHGTDVVVYAGDGVVD